MASEKEEIEVFVPMDEAGGGGGVAAAGGLTIDIENLRDAVIHVDTHIKTYPVVNLVSVEMRDAPALYVLLQKGKEKGWKVPALHKAEHLSKLSLYVDTVLVAVLPLLEEDPKLLSAGRLLKRYGWQISHLSRKVDGKQGIFHSKASDVSKLLISANKSLFKENEPIGEGKVAEIREALQGLQPLLVVFPKTSDGAGGGGAGSGGE